MPAPRKYPSGLRDEAVWLVTGPYGGLREAGVSIAPSTYYDAQRSAPSARAVRDEALKGEISRVHRDNYHVYGVPKVWLQLHREGIPVARCTVARLMRELNLRGVVRGK